ncbi:hypothetical protein KY289_006467 [Solanum tuberosum]|nr:hypothetical protein KY289_006467 [Solanum tuberosum]
MVIGDFNSILKADDRIGGNPATWSEIVDFNDCVTTCGLLEFPTQGNRYTWNDKHDGHRIFSKIDWIFMNNEWLDEMPSCRALFLPEGISDHCPARVTLSEICKTRKAFQFCNVWTKHPQLQATVQEGWNESIEGCMMFQVVRRLKLLKKKLRKLHSQAFRDIVSEAKDDREALKLAQKLLQTCPNNTEFQQRENMAYQKFRKSSYLAEIFLQQRSKATWIRLGDDNTRNTEGVWQTDPAVIAKLFVEYYEDVLGTETKLRVKAAHALISLGNVLSEEQQDRLVDIFYQKEVKKAIFQIDSNKSPGPDGFGSGFYKAAWSIVGQDVTIAALDFFRNSKLLRQINSTKVLAGFGFPDKFIKWIMTCVSTTMFSVKVNGENHGYFAGRRGLKQGDPMSPLLFVLVMEYLSRTLQNMSMLPDFRYHPMCKKVKLTHLIFADDLMIFCKGNLSSVNRVMEALTHFRAATGLEANLEKSSVFLVGVDEDTRNQILARTGFSVGEFPIKYLGLPLSPKKWTKIECWSLIAKITQRIKVTYSKQLSYAGRLQVINAVLFSIHSFWGAVFILPQSVLKEIDKICRAYLWGNSDETKKKVALVSWEKVCYPKKQGGLNIKGSSSWNIASVGQLVWQIVMNKETLLVKWVHGIYLREETSIWSHRAPIDSSWYWRKLNAIKEQMHGWYSQGRYILTSNGTYSITRSYLAIIGHRPQMRITDLVWNAVAIPKHRFMVWLAIQGRLLTQERKQKLHIQVDDSDCCLCEEKVMETNVHLFETCKWIKVVWQGIAQWTGIAMTNNGIKQVLERTKRKHWKQFQKETFAAICGAILYHTWRARNWKKFKGKHVHTEEAVAQIKKEIIERVQFFSSSRKEKNVNILRIAYFVVSFLVCWRPSF